MTVKDAEQLSNYDRPLTDAEQYFRALNETLYAATLPKPPAQTTGEDLGVIYIVGLPRSGTTLLSQLMSACFRVGYINNLIARFWLRPSVGIRLSQALLGEAAREQIGFQSSHGRTPGVADPHEFGFFWSHWLELGRIDTHHVPPHLQKALDRGGLRQQITDEILSVFGMPIVFKNVICGLHAEYLTSVYEKSVFVFVDRSIREICRSLLWARKAQFDDFGTWWSLRPLSYPEICQLESPIHQVVRQVQDCRREFETELGKVNVKCMTVRYDEVCREPENVLADIGRSLEGFGISVRRNERNVPRLRENVSRKLPGNMEDEMDKLIRQWT